MPDEQITVQEEAKPTPPAQATTPAEVEPVVTEKVEEIKVEAQPVVNPLQARLDTLERENAELKRSKEEKESAIEKEVKHESKKESIKSEGRRVLPEAETTKGGGNTSTGAESRGPGKPESKRGHHYHFKRGK